MRLRYLWTALIKRANGAQLVKAKFKRYSKGKAVTGAKARDQVQFFKNERVTNLKEPTAKWVIYPSYKYKQYWDIYIMVLMIYTATVFPVLTCFVDDSS